MAMVFVVVRMNDCNLEHDCVYCLVIINLKVNIPSLLEDCWIVHQRMVDVDIL